MLGAHDVPHLGRSRHGWGAPPPVHRPATNDPGAGRACANAVWSWDITKMRGPGKGSWFHAYVVIDIFSRYVLGWRIEQVEDGDLAADLVVDIVAEQGTAPGYLHADGGAAMTSKPLASLLVDLDVRRSHNRPRTSNDNPYSESQFKTMKYMADYPDRFASIGQARAWMAAFTSWYNDDTAIPASHCTPPRRCTTARPPTSVPPASAFSTRHMPPIPSGSTNDPPHPRCPNESPSMIPPTTAEPRGA